MSEKVDKGIMMWYGRLSYRRKFIRTLWIIPIDIAIMFGFYSSYIKYYFVYPSFLQLQKMAGRDCDNRQ